MLRDGSIVKVHKQKKKLIKAWTIKDLFYNRETNFNGKKKNGSLS